MSPSLPPEPAQQRPRLTRLLQAIATALLVSTFVAAVHDVSTSWDVWYYHLPFAARIWGIVPEQAYSFHALNEARFQGFPLLGELLQGLFWRAFGRPEASNLVAFAAVPLHALFLKRFFQVPLHLSVIGLMAIPLVQLHASSCYIDLPANSCAAMLVLLVYHLFTREGAVSGRTLVLLGVLAAGAVNMRFQLLAVVLLALLAATPRVLGPLFRDLGSAGKARQRALLKLSLIALSLPLVFASPLKNLVLHHNPFYPVKLAPFGIALPGVEDVYSSSPPYLEHAPRPLRFLYSLLEIGVRPMTSRRRWTIDQWMPEGSTGNRMGGFFGAYVVFHLAALGWATARARTLPARVGAALFAVLTAVTALLPQSHELRYYLYWMLVLVSLNLILACQRERLALSPSPPALGAAGAGALLIVLAVTRCGYVYPSGSSFATLLHDKVDPATLERIRDGGQACLSREPWTILYAATFHPPSRYAIQETERKEDCGAYRWIE
jgi:hypothetical protein